MPAQTYGDHGEVELHCGDSRDIVAALDDASIDAVVTDPPYELNFAGHAWDRSGIATDPQWWAECGRVLKPGGYLLAFGAPRRWHRVTAAIEDAGLEIRDAIAWIYTSGMPKSQTLPGGLSATLKPAYEPITVARRPFPGTLTENIARHHTGAFNIDRCRIPHPGRVTHVRRRAADHQQRSVFTGRKAASAYRSHPGGRWPTNLCVDHHQSAAANHSAAKPITDAFPVFRWHEKAPTRERVYHGDTGHDTVKPLDLMRWLVRLVTPPGGIVLEPFAGSGTTVEACIAEQLRCIAIEREPAYLPLIEQRIRRALSDPSAAHENPNQPGLFDEHGEVA